VRLPRDISAGAAARRALLADVLIALGLTALAIPLAAGIGVVGVLALLALLCGLLWVATEAAVRALLRRRRQRHPASGLEAGAERPYPRLDGEP
jgi:uncharacterized protein (DUF58 family)